MTQNPWFQLLLIAAGLYVAKLFRDDLLAAKAGRPHPGGLPGATPGALPLIVAGAVGALVLLAVETVGELRLGVSGEQSDITALMAAYTLLAAVIEEIIFRGYIVVTGRGKTVQWLAVWGASLLFAALHPFLWKWDGFPKPSTFELMLTTKGLWSAAMVFAASLWFYTLRFTRYNSTASLLPCIAAHAAKNAGVIVVKLVQGHISGWW